MNQNESIAIWVAAFVFLFSCHLTLAIYKKKVGRNADNSQTLRNFVIELQVVRFRCRPPHAKQTNKCLPYLSVITLTKQVFHN